MTPSVEVRSPEVTRKATARWSPARGPVRSPVLGAWGYAVVQPWPPTAEFRTDCGGVVDQAQAVPLPGKLKTGAAHAAPLAGAWGPLPHSPPRPRANERSELVAWAPGKPRKFGSLIDCQLPRCCRPGSPGCETGAARSGAITIPYCVQECCWC